MSVLYLSHMNVNKDELGRWVTILTQEISSRINTHEEHILLDTIQQIDNNLLENGEDGCIEYHNDDYTELDVYGSAVQKAIDTVNSVAGQTLLAPVTKINEKDLYRIEIEY